MRHTLEWLAAHIGMACTIICGTHSIPIQVNQQHKRYTGMSQKCVTCAYPTFHFQFMQCGWLTVCVSKCHSTAGPVVDGVQNPLFFTLFYLQNPLFFTLFLLIFLGMLCVCVCTCTCGVIVVMSNGIVVCATIL